MALAMIEAAEADGRRCDTGMNYLKTYGAALS